MAVERGSAARRPDGPPIRRILLATTNRSKLAEMTPFLTGLGVELVWLAARPDIPRAPEEEATFEGNARAKARYYAGHTGEVALAEDSGFEIDGLDGAPGVRSARLPGRDYAERMASLYTALAARGQSGSPARFVCALALAAPDALLYETRATVEGFVAPEPRGDGGFGYDPMFFYPPYGRTFGEASPDEKAAVSHRGQACRQLRDWLQLQA